MLNSPLPSFFCELPKKCVLNLWESLFPYNHRTHYPLILPTVPAAAYHLAYLWPNKHPSWIQIHCSIHHFGNVLANEQLKLYKIIFHLIMAYIQNINKYLPTIGFCRFFLSGITSLIIHFTFGIFSLLILNCFFVVLIRRCRCLSVVYKDTFQFVSQCFV